MGKIEITKESLSLAYRNANAEGKKLLSDLYGAKLFIENIKERLKTFADVCEEAGEKIQWYDIPTTGTDKDAADMCEKRLKLIARVFNGNWKPDLANISQNKYYPWFNIIPDTSRPSGFRLSCYFYDCVYDRSFLGARPYFKDSDTATHVGKQFIEEFENWAWYLNLSINQ